jgi:hypothetical protein
MEQLLKSVSGYKTYITAIVAIVTAVASYLTGEMALADALNLGFTALLAAFVRSGVTAENEKTAK